MGNTTKPRKHSCPVETAMELLSGKWKPRLLWKLHQRTMRYSELRRELTGITEKVLAQQLRELEHDNLITRKVYATVPPKVEYSLSEFGATLKPILDFIAQWGVSNQAAITAIIERQDDDVRAAMARSALGALI